MSTHTNQADPCAAPTHQADSSAERPEPTFFEKYRTIQAYYKEEEIDPSHIDCDAPGLRIISTYIGGPEETRFVYTFHPACGGSFQDEAEYKEYMETLTVEQRRGLEDGKLRVVSRDPKVWALLDAPPGAEEKRTQEFPALEKQALARMAAQLGLENEEDEEWQRANGKAKGGSVEVNMGERGVDSKPDERNYENVVQFPGDYPLPTFSLSQGSASGDEAGPLHASSEPSTPASPSTSGLTILGTTIHTPEQFRQVCASWTEAQRDFTSALEFAYETVNGEEMWTPAAADAGARFLKAMKSCGLIDMTRPTLNVQTKYKSLEDIPVDEESHRVLDFVAYPPTRPEWDFDTSVKKLRDAYWTAVKRCSWTSIFPVAEGLEVDPDAVFLATLERSKNEKFARRMAEQAIAMGDPKHWPEGYEVEEYRGMEKKGASDSAGGEISGETQKCEEEKELEDAKRLLEKLDVASADVDEKV
jgi:hypothetical protein